jgi:hypothetical protein
VFFTLPDKLLKNKSHVFMRTFFKIGFFVQALISPTTMPTASANQSSQPANQPQKGLIHLIRLADQQDQHNYQCKSGEKRSAPITTQKQKRKQHAPAYPTTARLSYPIPTACGRTPPQTTRSTSVPRKPPRSTTPLFVPK